MELSEFIILSLIATISCKLPPSDDNILHIGGIFPIGGEGGWQGGQVSIDFFFFKYLDP